jgi:hypothetical protein
MSNTPKISRDAGFERPKKIPTTRAKGAPARPIKLATRDPRAKRSR